MDYSDVTRKTFTMAVFEAGGAGHNGDSSCFVCGKAAERMLRFTDFSRSEPVEMCWCENCWKEYLESGKLENPLAGPCNEASLTPGYLISELNLTELPLPDALERFYGACEKMRGGCIRCTGLTDIPLVGPLKIKSQPLSNALDSLLGPVGMKWDICRDVIIIADSAEQLERLKKQEMSGNGSSEA